MNLLQMSFTGGVLILAVIVLRAMALNRLPKGTFLALWAAAVLRLLIPFSISSPASVYTLAEHVQARTAVTEATAPAEVPSSAAVPFMPGAAPAVSSGTAAAAPEDGLSTDVWLWVWLAGAAVCGAFFLLSYLRCRREFRTALPVENARLRGWLESRRLRRTVLLRRSDRVGAPVTYGIIHPVIIFPNATDWSDTSRLVYVLEHELTHIRHLDALWKLMLAFTACVHWFNPLVWCMLVLANRDMELRCDEAVVRRLGLERRSEYALSLISMEERKSGLGPFASAFSKNAIEERIRAIMKIKKRSLAAILAAVVLVCCVGVAFATSAAGESDTPYPQVQDGTFTKAELDRLSELWFEGYGDMTVAAYQQKMWIEFDTPEDIALIERYGQNSTGGGRFGSPEVILPEQAFCDYFFYVCEPLTAEHWQDRTFASIDLARIDDTHMASVEYTYTLHVPDAEKLTVGEYEQAHVDIRTGVRDMLYADPAEADLNALSQRLSTENLTVTVEGKMMWRDTLGNFTDVSDDPDTALYAQSSRETAAEWDRLLTPYVPFGLTYEFDDPDLDGNGLTMWFEGKEVRGIYDEQEHIWITEHAGTGFSDGAVELYTVYTDGRLTGLRLATTEEQAGFDEDRQNNARARIPLGVATLAVERREFPRAAREDYDAFLTLRRDGYRDESLESFNRRLLDWANENPDAWDRISCDVIWNDYGVNLTADERIFVSLTCALSGTENGMMIRALHTGRPEEDPGFSANMPEQARISEYAEKCVTEWCNLYYDISYHIADKSAVTVSERDACVSGMMNAIDAFWWNTDFDTLLQMTEEDIAAQFNVWAGENSTEGVQLNPVTADNIFFEHSAEGEID